jgi:primosomal protein N' (replication factor Y)
VRRRRLPHFESPGATYHVTWHTHAGLILTPAAREIALAACRFWHGRRLRCLLACVMPDHVHVLIEPLPAEGGRQVGTHSLSELLHSIKSWSAHEVNKAMGRKGAVWQDESFDRMIRSESDLHKTWAYIANNPRHVGLVGPMENYPHLWSPAPDSAVVVSSAAVAPASGGSQPASRRLSGGTDANEPSTAPAGDPASASPAVVSGVRPSPAASGPGRDAPAGPPEAGATAGVPRTTTGTRPSVHSAVAPASGGSQPASRRLPGGTDADELSTAPAGDPASASPAVVSGVRPSPAAFGPGRDAPAGPPEAGAAAGVPRTTAGTRPSVHPAVAPASGGSQPASRRLPGGTDTDELSTAPAGDPTSASPAVVSGVRPSPAASGPGRDAAAGPPEAGATAAKADASSSARTFLLHGVTGSGKTEVYLQAIAHALAQGRGAIVLVPEISLTPQTVERFKARFSSGPLRTLVAVLHSHLSAGERHDEWQKVRQGRARIVIGARSAVFAPVEPLGLIIVDEEHEHSYKQEEAPRYHARDVAVMRGQREGAVVVLGSATPSMESYHNAKRGRYALLELPHRVDDQRMPVVRVVDLRMESRKQKGPPVFSQQLRDAIQLRLDRREQTMLFLNRRGFATSMQCPQCGHVAGCPNCSVALTYHRQRQRLCCHICGHEEPAPVKCPAPKCGNPAIRYAGLGTEKVEDTLRKLFPKAEIRRMDSDTLKRKDDFRRILGDFRTGKIDILVGTQMIAKGLHFPNVTLVGIVYADLGLHLPDFRAGERTFQLLTQVAGRAGRGDVEGEVFVQAFTPFHPAIQYARRHDYVGFYEQEIEFREQLKYPPLARVALLTLKGRNEDKVKFTADHLRKLLEPLAKELTDLVLAGPAPAPLLRAETYYRHQLMLRTRQMSRLSTRLTELLGHFTPPEDVTIKVDVDPVDLM